MRLKVNHSLKKRKVSTNIEPLENEDIVKKTYLDTNLSKVKGQLSFIEENYNEFKLRSDKKKQYDDEFLIEKAVKTTIQTFYHKR